MAPEDAQSMPIPDFERTAIAVAAKLGIVSNAPIAVARVLQTLEVQLPAPPAVSAIDAAIARLGMDWKPTRQARGCLVYRLSDVNALKQALDVEYRTAEKAARERAAKDPSQAKWSGNPSAAVQRKLTITPYGLFSLRHTWITQASQDYSLQQLLDHVVTLSASKGSWRWYPTANRNKVSAALASGYAACGIRTMVLAQTARDLPSLAITVAELLRGKRTPATLLSNEQELVDLAAEELGDSAHAYLPIQGVVVIHHGMMLPAERRLSERLFGRKEGIFVLAVSPTLAQGVNLPADAIIIAGDDRWDMRNDTRAALAAHEILNAAGRAGRAGSSALGMVLVVPGSVVGFDQSTSQVEQRWFDLQEKIFSKSDQCLEIQDPIQKWLDRLQQSTTESPLDPSVQYFLTRLPVDSAGTDDAPRAFLSKTLAAYHAKRRSNSDQYERLVEHVLSLRAKHSGHTGSWHDGLSAANGVPIEIVHELDEILAGDSDIDSRDILGLPNGQVDRVRRFPQGFSSRDAWGKVVCRVTWPFSGPWAGLRGGSIGCERGRSEPFFYLEAQCLPVFSRRHLSRIPGRTIYSYNYYTVWSLSLSRG